MVRLTRLLPLAGALVAAPAAAHIQLDDPPARTSAQKTGPCGAADTPPDEVVATYAPGETITVRWRETINHPSHYRIAFDADGEDDFADPLDFMDFSGNPTVLLDAIADRDGGEYSAEVTLPEVTCERCTLQVVQVMYDKPPYGDGNDLYYQCADIAIVGEVPEVPVTPDVPEPDPSETPDAGAHTTVDAAVDATVDTSDDTTEDAGDDDGCSTTPGRTRFPAAPLLLGLAALALRRRRR
jgi:MYXO-CTERM domain-containing protein